LALALRVASQLSAFNIQDDAYIYARYADNILGYGISSWDPGGEPTYGATSHLHLAVALLVRALLPANAVLSMGLASLLSGVLALVLIARLVARGVPANAAERPWLLLFIAVPITLSAERVAAHMTDGMDTMVGLAALSLYMLCWLRLQRLNSRAALVQVALSGALCYASRPDFALYVLIVPAVVFCFSQGAARRRALACLALSVALIGGMMCSAWLYYDTPVPLSYFVKSIHSKFQPELGDYYAGIRWVQLQAYLESYWAFLLLIGVDLVFHFRRFVHSAGGLRLGLLIATLAHIGYYSLAVMQVVAFHQRFYYPTLPALCFLAAWSALDLFRDLKAEGGLNQLRLPLAVRALALLLVLRFVAPPLYESATVLRDEVRRDRFAHFDLNERYKRQSARFWFGLDLVSALPKDVMIATTEVGHLAAMNPNKRIIDMVGLNEAHFARNGFCAERLFVNYRPDICYMPHEHYKRMQAMILASPEFQSNYRLFEARDLQAAMGVALRRDSPYFEQLNAIFSAPRSSE
jgi:hypothetical protein